MEATISGLGMQHRYRVYLGFLCLGFRGYAL